MGKITDISILSEVKKFLRANFEKGCTCPACGQNVKQYKRKLGSAQSRALILLYKKNKDYEWVHIRDIIKEINIHGDFAKMVYWKLIKEKENDDESKRTSGFWQITELGRRFVLNQIKIPSHVFVYNAKLQSYSATQTTIKESLTKKFNYKELMEG